VSLLLNIPRIRVELGRKMNQIQKKNFQKNWNRKKQLKENVSHLKIPSETSTESAASR